MTNVFDLTGGPFLTLYGVLFVAAFIAGLVIPRWLKPEGHERRITDPDQLAYLAGGRVRFGDTVVTRLLANGALAIVGKDQFQIEDPHAGRTPAERSALAAAGGGWGPIDRALKPHAAPIEMALTRTGLLYDRATAWQMRFWQTTPYLLLLVFGLIKWEVGTMRDRPVGFLTAFLIITAIFALIRFIVVDRRTRGGITTLNDARDRSDRLRRAPTNSESDLAVALFGTAVLVGSPLGDFHQMRHASSSGDSGSSSSDGGSGCGGGGGGCGGCGS